MISAGKEGVFEIHRGC